MDKLKTYIYCIQSKANSKGEAPVRIRISVNGETINLASGVNINIAFWDYKKAKVKSKHPKASLLNKEIKEFEERIIKIWEDLKYQEDIISVQKIKSLIRNQSVLKMTLVFLINFHIGYIRERVGKQYSISSLKQFVTMKNKIERFLPENYACNDISLERINYEFVTRFEAFLSGIDKNSINTTTKYIKRLRTVLNVAFKNDWIKADPFARYRGKTEPSNRQFLNLQELERIENLDLIANTRLDMVRDVFMFMSYTGLSYCDIFRLNKENISIGINGKRFIRIERGKTKRLCEIPIFDKTALIIEKYQSNPICINQNVLLPVISNQKTNFHLKDIANKAKIEKPLTCHIARHSFATLSLENQVPIETVSKVLGHSSIRTTQIYGKITNSKIEFDYQKMAIVFGSSIPKEKKVG
ncbi:MAG: site-specific integrase [Sediminibacterium sp.]|nr:site-specific integrase [Sediminibacterium sp.]